MKLSRLTLALALAASCGLASAQTAPAPAPAPHVHPAAAPMPGHGMMAMGSPEQHKMRMDLMFTAADVNNDGSITRAEFEAHHVAMRGAHAGPGGMQGGMMHQGMKHGGGDKMGHCMPMDATPQADDEPKADAGK